MVDFRIGFVTSGRSFALSRMINELRSRSDAEQTSVVTGRHADTAAALAGRTAETIDLRSRLSELKQYSENTALAELRANVTGSALEAISEIVTRAANDASTAIASQLPTGKSATSQSARSSLEQIVSLLNSEAGGRALFAGDETDSTALNDADAFVSAVEALVAGAADAETAYSAIISDFDTPGGIFLMTLYEGGDGVAPSAEITPFERIQIAVRADETPLRDALRNMAVLAYAYDESSPLTLSERDRLAQLASEGLRSAGNGIAEIRARVGIAQEQIGQAQARNGTEQATLSRSLNELTARDPFEAAAAFSQAEASLETLLATTARLSRLTLIDFLR